MNDPAREVIYTVGYIGLAAVVGLVVAALLAFFGGFEAIGRVIARLRGKAVGQ